MSRITLILLCLFAFISLSACDAQEKALSMCTARIQETIAQDTSLFGRSVNPQTYCQCLIDNAKGGTIVHDDPTAARDCMITSAHDEFIRICEAEITPQINTGFDCGCFLNFTVDETIRMEKEGKATLTEDDRRDLGQRAMGQCSM